MVDGIKEPLWMMVIGLIYSKERNRSQTLSPFPLFPTVLNPSFQSPEPILGIPCSPKFILLSIAFIQCLYKLSTTFEGIYSSYLSSCPSSN